MVVKGVTGSMSSTRPELGVFIIVLPVWQLHKQDCLQLKRYSNGFQKYRNLYHGLQITNLNSATTNYTLTYTFRSGMCHFRRYSSFADQFISSGNTNQTYGCWYHRLSIYSTGRTSRKSSLHDGFLWSWFFLVGGVVAPPTRWPFIMNLPIGDARSFWKRHLLSPATLFVCQSFLWLWRKHGFRTIHFGTNVNLELGIYCSCKWLTKTFTFDANVPATDGLYTTSLVGFVGDTQIDQTMGTTG